MAALSLALPAGDVLGSVLNSVNNINLGDIASQVAMGAIVTAAAAGFKSQEGQNALDPLHIFHKDGSQTVINPSGKTISAAAFAALDAAGKSAVTAAGYQIVG